VTIIIIKQNMECFNTVNTNCAGLTVPVSEAGWTAFVSEIVSTGLAAIKIGLSMMAGSLTPNMVKGLNALRCVLASGFINAWYLIAAAYYAAAEFGQQQQIVDGLNSAYPYVCSCTLEVDQYATWFGASASTAANFDTCSETAAAAKANQTANSTNSTS